MYSKSETIFSILNLKIILLWFSLSTYNQVLTLAIEVKDDSQMEGTIPLCSFPVPQHLFLEEEEWTLSRNS